jgi:NAD(P)-dependent dehydrogenase (short-subunit alcohol dehydrogenase family)
MSALTGKKVVVVGGSSGIGLGVAAAALARNADVVIVGRSPEKLQTAVRTLGRDRAVKSIAVDTTNEAEVARLSPGWVDTPMWDQIVGEAKAGFFADMAPRLPARRIATPADVAAAYIYLMESELTTGETIRIDGGQNLI